MRDLLDKRLVTPEGKAIGQVDGVVLEIAGDSAPRVTALLVGGTTAAERVGGVLGRLLCWGVRHWGITHGAAYRIDFTKTRQHENLWMADVPLSDTPGAMWEARLRR